MAEQAELPGRRQPMELDDEAYVRGRSSSFDNSEDEAAANAGLSPPSTEDDHMDDDYFDTAADGGQAAAAAEAVPEQPRTRVSLENLDTRAWVGWDWRTQGMLPGEEEVPSPLTWFLALFPEDLWTCGLELSNAGIVSAGDRLDNAGLGRLLGAILFMSQIHLPTLDDMFRLRFYGPDHLFYRVLQRERLETQLEAFRFLPEPPTLPKSGGAVPQEWPGLPRVAQALAANRLARLVTLGPTVLVSPGYSFWVGDTDEHRDNPVCRGESWELRALLRLQALVDGDSGILLSMWEHPENYGRMEMEEYLDSLEHVMDCLASQDGFSVLRRRLAPPDEAEQSPLKQALFAHAPPALDPVRRGYGLVGTVTRGEDSLKLPEFRKVLKRQGWHLHVAGEDPRDEVLLTKQPTTGWVRARLLMYGEHHWTHSGWLEEHLIRPGERDCLPRDFYCLVPANLATYHQFPGTVDPRVRAGIRKVKMGYSVDTMQASIRFSHAILGVIAVDAFRAYLLEAPEAHQCMRWRDWIMMLVNQLLGNAFV